MQQFRYVAVNLHKEKFTGIFLAQDERDLATQLAKQNLFLISCSPYKGLSPNSFFTLGSGKVKLNDLTTFCRQFAIMINSGNTVLECLASLKDQTPDRYLKSVLTMVYEDVKSGVMLSDAFTKHKKVFPDFFRSMIYVGEMSGNLETVFNALADYYENDTRIKKQVKSALSYPVMLLSLVVVIVIAMMVFIVPTFRKSLSSLDLELNGITKAVYGMSDFFLANWKGMLVGVLVVAAVLFAVSRTEKGKFFLDKLKLQLPLVKNISIDLVTARFARSFALLLASGMDITQALDAVQVVIGNRDVKRRFGLAVQDVREGTQLSDAFTKYKLFPELLIQMIAVGEKTAALGEVLMRSCDFFDEQVRTTITKVTGRIQPIMLIMLGLVVGVMFIAVYSPMLSIMQSIGG